MATQQGTSTGSTANVSERLNASMTNAGSALQKSVGGLATVHTARLAQQQRYAASLEKEYGPNDSGTKAAKAKVAATKLVIARTTAAQQQTKRPSLALNANQWALQGNVYDANSQPISKLTVFLVDAEKAWQRQFGFAYTDANGYFLLRNNPSQSSTSTGAATGAATGASTSAATGTAPADTPRDSAIGNQTGTYYIEIADDRGQPIWIDKTAFTPVLGQASYRKITLKSQSPLGDPPRPIHEVAIPPQG